MFQPVADSPPSTTSDQTAASRRAVLTGTGVAVVAGAAGFGWYLTAGPTPGATAPVAGYSPPAPAGEQTALTRVDAMPEGGGVVVTDQSIVVTREGADTVRAFSAVCTHQGCLVSGVSGGKITCPCHGSTFDAATGAVLGGPAPSPLPPVAVKVTDGQVYRA